MGYDRPTDLTSALERRALGGGRVLAGGTDLFPATDRPGLAGDILDITGIAALRGLSQDDGYFRIGAATRWSDVAAAELPPAFDVLREAAREVGSVQIQNAGTVGGNLCNASPAADGVPPLLVLEAEAELRSVRGDRRLPLAEFLTGVRRTALAEDELLTAVLIPEAAARGRSRFLKLGARKYLVISIAMVAVRVETEDDIVTDAALAVGACSPVAVRLHEIEAALAGCPIDKAAAAIADDAVAAALAPIGDIRADAAYRGRSAAELLRRAVAGALAP